MKSGFIGLVGRPNVGKSTLLNAIIGRKVAITSDKPQTTRNIIQGIRTDEDTQMVFVDTPGIHKPHHELGNFMNRESLSTITDSDMILYLIDGTVPFGSGDEFVISQLKKSNVKVYLVVNKIDLVNDKNQLIVNVDKFIKSFDFCEVYYISALTGENVNDLLISMENNLDPGPMYYPKEEITDHPLEFVISEIIREKVLILTKEEVPHSVAVVIDKIGASNEDSEITEIFATIICERKSQKKIIIGSNGKMIKQIGSLARKELKLVMGAKIYLELWVKVNEDWRNKKSDLRRLGYSFDIE